MPRARLRDLGLKVGTLPPGPFNAITDVPGVAVEFHHAEGDKCARCWMILPEVGRNQAHPDLCNRCSEAVDGFA